MPHNESSKLNIQTIPPGVYPRNTNAKEYARDLGHQVLMLRYTNQKVQYSSQICSFSIESINRKKGFSPSFTETMREIQNFVYHYENYCSRLYSYREKLLQFINASLPVGYKENQVRMHHIIINPIVKQAGMLPEVQKFQNNSSLNKMIEDRTLLTHKRYFGEEFDYYLRPATDKQTVSNPDEFKKWCNDWRQQIISRAKHTNEGIRAIEKIEINIADKVVLHRNKQREINSQIKPKRHAKKKDSVKN